MVSHKENISFDFDPYCLDHKLKPFLLMENNFLIGYDTWRE